MEAFFKKTGVKPYLYLTDNVYGSTEPSDKQMDTFANSLYDKLFTDENHFLLVFQEYGDYYMTWYVSGSDAAEVVDEEAANIVLDYVDEYYSCLLYTSAWMLKCQILRAITISWPHSLPKGRRIRRY